MSWYKNTYKKLFFNYHSDKNIVDLASSFNAKKWAERVQKTGAEAVSVFVKGACGWSYYRKGKVRSIHPHLPEGLDMVEEQIKEFHKRNIKVIGYYHTFKSQPLAEEHPDWIQRKPEEKPNGFNICLLSPVFKEIMLPQIEEIVNNYDLDGLFFDGTIERRLCYCKYCQKRFKEDTGLDLPEDNKSPHWNKYVFWKKEILKEIRKKVRKTIHNNNTELNVSFNWAYAPRLTEEVPEEVGSLMADVHPPNQALNGDYVSRYWATLKQPFDIMNTAFLKWWGDWDCKPAISMKQEIAPVLANGGLSWIGYQMTGDFDVEPAVMNELSTTLSFIEKRESLFKDSKPVPYIAILHSAHLPFREEKASFFSDEKGTRGAHRLLTKAGFHFNIVNEKHLKENANKYQAIILPDQRYIDKKLRKELTAFVEKGGLLLATYLTGTQNDNYKNLNSFEMKDLFGVEYEKDLQENHAYIDIKNDIIAANTLKMPHMVEGKFACVNIIDDNVEEIASLRSTGYSAITKKKYGQGLAIYVSGQVFTGYQDYNQWNLKQLIENLLNNYMSEQIIKINSPGWIEVVYTQRNHQKIVHLINYHGDRVGDEKYIKEVLPVQGINLEIKYEQLPEQVMLEPENMELNWSYDGERLSIYVPQVNIHSAVVIE